MLHLSHCSVTRKFADCPSVVGRPPDLDRGPGLDRGPHRFLTMMDDGWCGGLSLWVCLHLPCGQRATIPAERLLHIFTFHYPEKEEVESKAE